MPKMGQRASTGIFAYSSVSEHCPVDSVCISLGYQSVVVVQPSQDRNRKHLGSLMGKGTR
jgi:hypothetical protein